MLRSSSLYSHLKMRGKVVLALAADVCKCKCSSSAENSVIVENKSNESTTAIQVQQEKLVRVEGNTDVNATRNLWRANRQNRFKSVPQTWVYQLGSGQDSVSRIGLMELHPAIFAVVPRLDILHQNIRWQTNYRNLQFTKMLVRPELSRSNTKPHMHKKMGMARAASVRAPHWSKGGFAHGARGPRTWFYMLSDPIRLQGLCVSLTLKQTQSDLVLVDNFDHCSHESLEALVKLSKNYPSGEGASSALFVEKNDHSPLLAAAAFYMPTYNVMPLYGLNCFSMLKHDLLVLSVESLKLLEERLLAQLHRAEPMHKKFRYMDWKERLLKEGEGEDDDIHPPFV